MLRRLAATLAAVLLAGCGAAEPELGDDAVLTVYVSLPLSGPEAGAGGDAADGARLALADAAEQAGGVRVEAVFLDAADRAGPWPAAAPASNARTATEDTSAIAYVGDLSSGATRASLPITNQAGLLQVSPASSADDLIAPFLGSDELPELQPSGRTFGRVIAADAAQAEAAATWIDRIGVDRVATVDDGGGFGRGFTREFEESLERAGLVRRAGAELVLYAGEGRPPSIGEARLLVSDAQLAPDLLRALPAGTLASSAALDPSQLPPAGRELADEFDARFDRDPGRYAAYGYEAMAVVLDSIDRASDPADRASVVEAFLATADRDSILGTYSIDDVGQASPSALTGYRLGPGGRPRPAAELSP